MPFALIVGFRLPTFCGYILHTTLSERGGRKQGTDALDTKLHAAGKSDCIGADRGYSGGGAAGAFGVLARQGDLAALAGLAASLVVAVVVYHMPVSLAALAALDGAAYGLFPIGWIVLGAIFVYDITVHTGQFEIVKHSIAGLADDRRIQAILIAFCFGSFIEGAAGFGTPVAISAAMLIGLGFRPLVAAGLALIGNTAPVAFGALGTPILVLSKVTAISPELLSAMVGKQLTIFALIIPFWLIWAMAGWRSV